MTQDARIERLRWSLQDMHAIQEQPTTVEDHMQFCFDCRKQTRCFVAQQTLRGKRTSNLCSIFSVPGISSVDTDHMLRDSASCCLEWGQQKQEFDKFLKWQSNFIRYLKFALICNSGGRGFSGSYGRTFSHRSSPRHNSRFVTLSKTFTEVSRRSKDRWLFDSGARLSLENLFQRMDGLSPLDINLTGAVFAAFLFSNPKQRFFIDIHAHENSVDAPRKSSYSSFWVEDGTRSGAFQSTCRSVSAPSSTHIWRWQALTWQTLTLVRETGWSKIMGKEREGTAKRLVIQFVSCIAMTMYPIHQDGQWNKTSKGIPTAWYFVLLPDSLSLSSFFVEPPHFLKMAK